MQNVTTPLQNPSARGMLIDLWRVYTLKSKLSETHINAHWGLFGAIWRGLDKTRLAFLAAYCKHQGLNNRMMDLCAEQGHPGESSLGAKHPGYTICFVNHKPQKIMKISNNNVILIGNSIINKKCTYYQETEIYIDRDLSFRQNKSIFTNIYKQ